MKRIDTFCKLRYIRTSEYYFVLPAPSGISYNPEYLTWSGEGIGRYLVFFAIEGVLYFALVFVVDSDLFKKMIQGIRKVLCCRKKRLVYSETDKAINVEVRLTKIRKCCGLCKCRG